MYAYKITPSPIVHYSWYDGTYHADVCWHCYERSQILYQRLYQIDLTYQQKITNVDAMCAIHC